MSADPSEDLIGDLLVLTELTELAARVPAGARERWALDCAGRAVGVDLAELATHQRELKWCLASGRARLRHMDDETAKARLDDAIGLARDHVAALAQNLEDRPGRGRLRRQRALAAANSAVWALRCVEGEGIHEQAARSAQRAFEDPVEEARAQGRRLLLRTKLIPSGADLLVRLDYAEARGALPDDPAERAWIDNHRALLMAEDEDGRFAVVLRYRECVFLAELERAG